MTKILISKATERNWARLNVNQDNRLTKRANKRGSKKKILPIEYFANHDNVKFVDSFTEYCEKHLWSVGQIIYSVAVSLLRKRHILNAPHVQRVLKEYNFDIIPESSQWDIPEDEWDILGLLYQSMLREGEKNLRGSYYTPQKVTSDMTGSFDFSHHQTFLDPCCGSGAFLISLRHVSPEQIFGFDNDPTAVMLAKINMLLHFYKDEFSPQIFCQDYLEESNLFPCNRLTSKTFDYIATNPPWGACVRAPYGEAFPESFSCFFIRAFGQLNKNGLIRFLFPEAVLNVKSHQALRKFMLDNCRIEGISFYSESFSGVMTKYIGIFCKKASPISTLSINKQGHIRQIQTSSLRQTKDYAFSFVQDEDLGIIEKIRSGGRYDLSQSAWALGIVTGDNKGKIKKNYEEGCEPIFTGKEILRYVLKPAKNYLRYDRSQLQQVAKEELYRAKEKLVYKFISKRLIFAYDNLGRLFLNSANILIPSIPGMGIKTVMAFLNSEIFQYFYLHIFGDLKVLKGNLLSLSFPSIAKDENEHIEAIVDKILEGEDNADVILQDIIYRIYGFSKKQIEYVRRDILDGTVDKRA